MHSLYFLSRKPRVYERPFIRRTRSWRGVMQVRYNDTKLDRNKLAQHAFFWSPLRLFGMSTLVSVVIYLLFGHDRFMQILLGYESEMLYETRVNPSTTQSYESVLDKDKAWRSPMRNLEKPLHSVREFDLLRDPNST